MVESLFFTFPPDVKSVADVKVEMQFHERSYILSWCKNATETPHHVSVFSTVPNKYQFHDHNLMMNNCTFNRQINKVMFCDDHSMKCLSYLLKRGREPPTPLPPPPPPPTHPPTNNSVAEERKECDKQFRHGAQESCFVKVSEAKQCFSFFLIKADLCV